MALSTSEVSWPLGCSLLIFQGFQLGDIHIWLSSYPIKTRLVIAARLCLWGWVHERHNIKKNVQVSDKLNSWGKSGTQHLTCLTLKLGKEKEHECRHHFKVFLCQVGVVGKVGKGYFKFSSALNWAFPTFRQVKALLNRKWVLTERDGSGL